MMQKDTLTTAGPAELQAASGLGFRAAYPLDFQLLNSDDGTENLYLGTKTQSLNLTIINRTKWPVTLPQNLPAASGALKLLFRSSILDTAVSEITADDWSVTPEQLSAEIVALDLAFNGAKAVVIEAGQSLTLSLNRLMPKLGNGERRTRVDLVYSSLPLGSGTIDGSRSQLLQLVQSAAADNLGPGYPFAAGFVYPPNLINDGQTPNKLVVRIVNSLGMPINLAGNPEFTFAFDVQTAGKLQPYALIENSHVANVAVQQRIDLDDPTASNTKWVPATGGDDLPFFAQQPVTDSSGDIMPGTAVQFVIEGLTTTLPDGVANLYVGFRNFMGMADGQIVLSVTKSGFTVQGVSELRASQQAAQTGTAVGINVAAPAAALDVRGGIQTDQVTTNGTDASVTTGAIKSVLTQKEVFGISLENASLQINGSAADNEFSGIQINHGNLGIGWGDIWAGANINIVGGGDLNMDTTGDINVTGGGNIEVTPKTVGYNTREGGYINLNGANLQALKNGGVTIGSQMPADGVLNTDGFLSIGGYTLFQQVVAGTLNFPQANLNNNTINKQPYVLENIPFGSTDKGDITLTGNIQMIGTATRYWMGNGTCANCRDSFSVTFQVVDQQKFHAIVNRTDGYLPTDFGVTVNWVAFTLKS